MRSSMGATIFSLGATVSKRWRTVEVIPFCIARVRMIFQHYHFLVLSTPSFLSFGWSEVVIFWLDFDSDAQPWNNQGKVFKIQNQHLCSMDGICSDPSRICLIRCSLGKFIKICFVPVIRCQKAWKWNAQIVACQTSASFKINFS